MEKREIIMEYYELKKQLLELKKQQIEKTRDKDIEEQFEVLVTGKPKIKTLKRKSLRKMLNFV